MKTLRTIMFCVLSLVMGCSSGPVKNDELIKNPRQLEEIGSYLRLFKAEAEKRGVLINYEGLRVYFADGFSSELEEHGVIGFCDFKSDKQIIVIRKPSWDSYDSLQREMLIFHEMGHCLLDQVHDESTDFDSVPEDLMYPSNFPSFYYARKRSEYLSRMFAKFLELQAAPEMVTPHRSLKKRHMCRWGKMYRPEVTQKRGYKTK